MEKDRESKICSALALLRIIGALKLANTRKLWNILDIYYFVDRNNNARLWF